MKLGKSSRVEDAKQIAKLKNDNGALKQTIEICLMKANELEENFQELKRNQSRLVSELETCKSTDVDFVISQRELKGCYQDLEAEKNRNRQCESDRTTCENKLENQKATNRQFQARNSELTKSLKEFSSSSSTPWYQLELIPSEIGP